MPYSILGAVSSATHSSIRLKRDGNLVRAGSFALTPAGTCVRELDAELCGSAFYHGVQAIGQRDIEVAGCALQQQTNDGLLQCQVMKGEVRSVGLASI